MEVVDRQLLRGAHRLVSGIESTRGIAIPDQSLLRFMVWGVWTSDLTQCQSTRGRWSLRGVTLAGNGFVWRRDRCGR
jgi:hypothetical protein